MRRVAFLSHGVAGVTASGIDAAKAGMAARDLDAEVRNFIAAAGYGEAFGHGLGHGVGVEVHEAPRVGTASTGTLREGTLFTIEPGAPFLATFVDALLAGKVVSGFPASDDPLALSADEHFAAHGPRREG